MVQQNKEIKMSSSSKSNAKIINAVLFVLVAAGAGISAWQYTEGTKIKSQLDQIAAKSAEIDEKFKKIAAYKLDTSKATVRNFDAANSGLAKIPGVAVSGDKSEVDPDFGFTVHTNVITGEYATIIDSLKAVRALGWTIVGIEKQGSKFMATVRFTEGGAK